MTEYKPKKCKFCGKEFTPTSRGQKYCNGPHIRICPVCGKKYVEKNNDNLNRPPVVCSYECRAKKTRETSMKRYGVPAPGNNPDAREKSKKTMQEKYGVDYTLQSNELKEKVKETNIQKYGVDNVGKSQEIINKRQETNHERYGDVMPFNRKECYEKQHETMMERYGTPYFVLSDNFDQYGGNMVSNINRRFKQKLENNGIKCKLEHRIENRSYDIEILDTNILIEIDPTYTHSTQGNHFNSTGLDPNYHYYKTSLAEDNGYRCIHIFDWDDQEKIIGTLKPKIKISADSCRLWRLSKEATNEFLDKYDLQGSCRNQLLCLGLVYEDELLQVMTFGKSIYDKNHNIVIRRMCTKFGYDIIGGYHRMLNYATETMELYSIMIYVDASKYSKDEYENLDMTFLKKNQPRKIWSKDDKYKMDYTNRIYLSKDKDFISSSKSYDEYMLDNGWCSIYDCGTYIFED